MTVNQTETPVIVGLKRPEVLVVWDELFDGQSGTCTKQPTRELTLKQNDITPRHPAYITFSYATTVISTSYLPFLDCMENILICQGF